MRPQGPGEKNQERKHVVIVGGGFAGLNCAKNLAKHPALQVTLIDRNNYQQFQPLLYQVASMVLSPGNIAFNLRRVLRGHPNVDVKLTEIGSVDLSTRSATSVEGQTYQGDFLVLAAGAQANFFGTPGAAEHSYPLYSLRDAEALRSRILAVFESADRDASLVEKGALNFVIVGAGATGTEMAGAFGDAFQHSLKRAFSDMSDMNLSRGQVFLVDGGHSVLHGFSRESQSYAAKMLEERGVQTRLGMTVKEVGSGHVMLSDGSSIDSRVVIWAGGLKASSLSDQMGIQTGKGGRIDVQLDLTVPNFNGVYALGDFANIAGDDGKPLPQLASVAEQSGKWCAKNILADIAGLPRKPFAYFDKGIMAMIGRNSAVAEMGKHRHELKGPLAFAAWLGVHAALLSSTQAKIEAFVEWAWDYFGAAHGDAILDWVDEGQINWNDDAERATSTPPGPKTDRA
jgi:NADH:ubiquinone reductase (H+-translocating)